MLEVSQRVLVRNEGKENHLAFHFQVKQTLYFSKAEQSTKTLMCELTTNSLCASIQYSTYKILKWYLKNKILCCTDHLPLSSLIWSWFLSSFSEASKSLHTFINLTNIYLSHTKIVTFPCLCFVQVDNLIPWMFSLKRIISKPLNTFIFAN